MPVELIRRLRVNDVDGEHAITRRLTIKPCPVVVDVLLQMRGRLQRDPGAAIDRVALERIGLVVVDLRSFREVRVEPQPPQYLRMAVRGDSAGGLVAAAKPWAVPSHVSHAQPAL